MNKQKGTLLKTACVSFRYVFTFLLFGSVSIKSYKGGRKEGWLINGELERMLKKPVAASLIGYNKICLKSLRNIPRISALGV
jgi:hypothetical protein